MTDYQEIRNVQSVNVIGVQVTFSMKVVSLRRQCIKCRNNARDKYECKHFRVKYECKECGTVVSCVNHAAARLGVSLPACRRLLFPLLHAEKGPFPRATKEIGDVCTQARCEHGNLKWKCEVCKAWVALGKVLEKFVYLAVEICHLETLPSATPSFQVGKKLCETEKHQRCRSAWVGQADFGKLELNNIVVHIRPLSLT